MLSSSRPEPNTETSSDNDRYDEPKPGSSNLGQSLRPKSTERGVLGEVAGNFPSDTFLWLALISIALSASMKISGRSKDANFIGEWAPTFLGLGIFSKLMKLEKVISKIR